MRITVSEVCRCELDDEALKLLEEFPKMLEWWAEKALTYVDLRSGRQRDTRYAYSMFRNAFYKEWREKWKEWNSQYAQTSSVVVHSSLQLRHPNHASDKLNLRMRFATVHPKIVRVKDGVLRVSTRLEEYARIKLFPNSEYQRKMIDQAERRVWQIGHVFLTPEYTVIPLSKSIDISMERDPALEELSASLKI